VKLRELKSFLRAYPASLPRFILPDGQLIPAHFHITEVGHVARKFLIAAAPSAIGTRAFSKPTSGMISAIVLTRAVSPTSSS
jgi:hypothetical protein